jgi:hypothetical protein
LQSSTAYAAAFIVNPLNLDIQRANSDFDIRHLINANWIAALPFGHGQKFLGNTNPWVNGVIGGWEVTGIFRYNTGLPSGQPFDQSQWATNWNVQSNGVATRPRRVDSHKDRRSESLLEPDGCIPELSERASRRDG